MYSGRAELDANNGVPHSSQNSRVAILLLSAVCSKCFAFPRVTRTALVAMIKVGEYALPLAI